MSHSLSARLGTTRGADIDQYASVDTQYSLCVIINFNKTNMQEAVKRVSMLDMEKPASAGWRTRGASSETSGKCQQSCSRPENLGYFTPVSMLYMINLPWNRILNHYIPLTLLSHYSLSLSVHVCDGRNPLL